MMDTQDLECTLLLTATLAFFATGHWIAAIAAALFLVLRASIK